MFGYITPDKEELKVKEYEVFKAFYCGVCKSIGKRLGQLPRFTLTYDSAFLAILLSSIQPIKMVIKSEICIAHPLKKRNIVKENEFVDYSSDMNVVLAYYKMLDDWKDEKKVYSLAAKSMLDSSFRKVYKKYEDKCDIIKNNLSMLNKLEDRKCKGIDEAAEPCAKLMEELIDYPGIEDENTRKTIRWIGYNIGKWIYSIDAFDDIDKDIKGKNYNPILLQYEYNTNTDIEEFKKEVSSQIEFSIFYCLNEISKAYSLLETNEYRGIVENIIFLGMPKKTDSILKGSCIKSEESI